MYSGKEVSELVGYTSRVYSLVASLYALETGDYLKPSADASVVESEDKVTLSCS
jgi:ATP-binding cassette subfamily D (ALD) long-chain fatty acid import protein